MLIIANAVHKNISDISIKSIENVRMLLLCLQGLLKVAIDNTRAQEKQVQLEKSDLKMELFREREMRETLERQLVVEQKNRGDCGARRAEPAVPHAERICACTRVRACVFCCYE